MIWGECAVDVLGQARFIRFDAIGKSSKIVQGSSDKRSHRDQTTDRGMIESAMLSHGASRLPKITEVARNATSENNQVFANLITAAYGTDNHPEQKGSVENFRNNFRVTMSGKYLQAVRVLRRYLTPLLL